MTFEEMIFEMYKQTDDAMSDMPEHPNAKLYASETLTPGILFALKGVYFRFFYRWPDRWPLFTLRPMEKAFIAARLAPFTFTLRTPAMIG